MAFPGIDVPLNLVMRSLKSRCFGGKEAEALRGSE
jgi:hypothetical protein